MTEPAQPSAEEKFSMQEMRIALTAFALWLRTSGHRQELLAFGPVQLVDRFLEETM